MTTRYHWVPLLRDVTIADCQRIPQVLIQFDTTNLAPDLSEATFAIVPDNYRAEQIAFINSIVDDLNE